MFFTGGGTQKKSVKDAIDQETALPWAGTKQGDELYPQGDPLTQGQLQKYLDKNVTPFRLLSEVS